ncbi:RHS repeat-associated core domain-containing protein [Lysobacter sp. Hz 25]|uniref:RHS repeat-associated core domain-containing protein n=1 Tax=Lysobacter sp. Hz 25 TaxID=3383698 RepID=UPI0038D4EE28
MTLMACTPLRFMAAACVLLSTLVPIEASAQVPEYEYRATRYMPSGESQTFKTLAEAEAYIRTEPATPRGNVYLERSSMQFLGIYGTLFKYNVPRRAYERYVGDFYDGHMSGNATDCSGLKCDTEEEMVAASMRAYPLLNSYTATLRGAYLSPPFAMWGSEGQNARIVMNAVQYSGAPIPNQREILARSNATGAVQYTYRVNRVDFYGCPALFNAVDNTYGEPSKGVWPLICHNGATGSITKVAKQYAPSCDALPPDLVPRDGNPCASDTGNKEYRESDFSWEGRDFQRVYNSIGEVSLLSGMGDNWAHPFSGRLMFANGGYPNLWVRADGYIESLASAGEMYRPSSSKNAALRKEADAAVIAAKGAWELMRPDGSSLWFRADGRLRRIENGAGVLSLDYCSGAALGTESCPHSDYVAKVTSSSGRSLAFEYTSIAAPVGTGSTRYDARVKRVLADGTVLAEYEYDTAARLVRVRHGGPSGPGRQYLYAEADLLCRDHQGNAIANCNVANYPNNLTGVVDEQGVRITRYTYDDKNRVTSSEHAGGAGRVSLNYVSATSVEVTLPAGARKTYTFNSLPFKRPTQAVISTTDGGSRTVSAGYTNDRVSHSIGGTGGRTNLASSDGLHETSRVEGLTAAGATTVRTRTTQTDWHAASGLPAERRVYDAGNVLVGKQAWTYNGRRQALTASTVDPVSSTARTTALTYCEPADVAAGNCPIPGLVTAIDGPRTDVADTTLYTYYPSDDSACATSPSTCAYRKGDLWMVTDALGHVTEYLRYDAASRLLSSKDANGVVTDLEYYPRGWLKASKVRGANAGSETDDVITRYEYDLIGQVKKVIQPDGAFVRYDYDAAHRLSDIYDNAGNRIHYTVDAAGNRTQDDTRDASGALKRTLSRIYNQLGQLKTAKTADGHPTAFTYDAAGNGDLTTDALNRKTDSDYDPLNRLAKTLQDVGGINAKIEYRYDALDRLTQVNDPKGLNTTYGYNGFGDQVQLSSPDTGVTTRSYNAAGQVATKQDANDAAPHTYTYDALGRTKTVSYGSGANDVEYDYDTVNAACAAGETFAIGRVTAMRTEGTELKYCYDRFGRVVRKVQSVDAQSFTLRYAYTPAGELSALTYPDGAVADYARDAQGRIVEIGVTPAGGVRSVLLNNVTYLPFGPATGWTYGNGRSLSRSYDLDYRAKTIFDPGAGGLSLAYGYNAVGELTELKDGLQSAFLAKYDYDALGRLKITRDGPTGTPIETYGYDATGNRTSLLRAGTTTAYTYPATSHRLTEVGGIARGYDAVGNTTSIGGAKEFVYNSNDRMSQVKLGGVVSRSYRYNAKGERVAATNGASGGPVAVYTLYDEASHWIGDYDAIGTATQQVIWLGDLPVGVIVGASIAQKLHYVQPDHLGTPRTVIDAARDVAIWSWNAKGEAFGADVPNQDPDQDGTAFVFDLRFSGQRYDTISGLNQNGFREYDAATGRYSQSDPIGLGGGISTYSYVGGSPLTSIDPFGLEITTADAYCVRYGPAACAEVMAPKPPVNLAPSALGSGLAASIWCWATGCTVPGGAAYSPVPRRELTKLEERQFDRYCVGSEDPCEELKKATRAAIAAARVKMNAMLIDRDKMYGKTGWVTHTADLKGRLDNIAAMISLGQKVGCDMSAEIALATDLFLPSVPR